ncbi:hypothetical protein LUZ60_010744 [Juncus effusus]|nr:hypothetical protein LUZ60_010744 [Juncus effusus]
MKGYEYLVRGENAQKVKAEAPDYEVILNCTDRKKSVTLENVWQCPSRLLSAWDHDNKIKDICLSYALHKMLRPVMENYTIIKESFYKTQSLVFEGILRKDQDDERVFQIAEMEIAFLNDYYHTRYPMIMWYEFPIINVFTFTITVVCSCLLASSLHKNYKFDHPHGIPKVNLDVLITYALLLFIVLREIWEIIVCTFSDWTKLTIVCKYVEWFRGHHMRDFYIFSLPICPMDRIAGLFRWILGSVEHIAWFLCTHNVVNRWGNKMPQYNFLETYNYKPWIKRILHYGTLHIIPKPVEGGYVLRKIKVNKEVKKSIARALRSMKIRSDHLMDKMPPLFKSNMKIEYRWACKGKTCTDLILVWHIATSMCEIDIYREHRTQHSWWLSPFFWIKDWYKEPFLLNLKTIPNNVHGGYIAANSLSRYCAYLLIFVSELLPDNNVIPEIIFEQTVSDARKDLQGCDSLESVYQRLMEIGVVTEEEQDLSRRQDMTILRRGAILGRALIRAKMTAADRWEMLAKFWANLLLYMAPSYMMNEHKQYLMKGGELITLFWTVFTHAGIFDRSEEEEEEEEEEEDSHGEGQQAATSEVLVPMNEQEPVNDDLIHEERADSNV